MQSAEVDDTAHLPPDADSAPARRRWGLRTALPVGSFVVGAVVVSALFATGAWQRRWIADDGLIVLRTLRNLFAGNGPVFNAGERVESNTSTAWTYVLWFWSWVTDGRLEYVALWVALVLSVSAVPLAMYGTARLLRTRFGGVGGRGYTLLLPLGAVVYIALPPARDFATSGLETCLCLFWAAVLWCQLVAWSRRPRGGRRAGAAVLAMAFWAGLAPLIRPELTLLGGLVLLMIFFSPVGWRLRIGIVVVAAVLPVGYQIFRMGYYALLVPTPAVAKDASGSKWHQGFTYLGNLFGPYTLVLPVVLVVVAGVVLGIEARRRRTDASPSSDAAAIPDAADHDAADHDNDDDARHRPSPAWRERASSVSHWLQSPTAVVTVVVLGGLLVGVYWLRQGGDFMHGRVLLAPLFIMLLPLMVIPVTIPARMRSKAAVVEQTADPDDPDVDHTLADERGHTLADDPAVESGDAAATRSARTRQIVGSMLMVAVWVTTVIWAVVVHENVLSNNGIDIGRSGIVDERRFYVTNMGNENPVTAQDYLDYPRMRAMVADIDKYRRQGAVILPSANYDEWYVAQLPDKMPPGVKRQETVFFLNLGMTSMNAPLDVRVEDQMGLSYPLATHTERLPDGRIGHDKDLPQEWVVAESGAVPRYPVLPAYLDEDKVQDAREALTCPATKDLFASFEAPWSLSRFRHNLRQSFGFSGYRIEREPQYEIQRCGLVEPPRIHPK